MPRLAVEVVAVFGPTASGKTAVAEALADAAGTEVVAAGTGLYLRAALADLELPPRVRPDVRMRWGQVYDRDPAQAFAELEARDPQAAAMMHPNDRRRVVRAL